MKNVTFRVQSLTTFLVFTVLIWTNKKNFLNSWTHSVRLFFMLNANAIECTSAISEAEDLQNGASLETNFYTYLFISKL